MRRAFTRAFVVGCCIAVSVLAVSFPADAAGSKRGRGEACIGNVEAWLKEGGVDLGKLSDQFTSRRTFAVRSTTAIRGLPIGGAWVRFKDREGRSISRCGATASWSHSGPDGVEWNGPGADC